MGRSRVELCDTDALAPDERLLIEVENAEICVMNVGGDKGALTVVCPWHGWTYEVETGDRLGPTDHSLPSYPVTVENETVYLATESIEDDTN